MSPIEKTWNGTSDTKTFTIAPTSTGTITLTLTSLPQLESHPTDLSYDCVAVGQATSYTLTGPKTAPIGATSIPFTITPKTTPVLQSDGTYLDAGTYSGKIRITDSRDDTYVDYEFSSSTPQTFTVTATNSTPFYLKPTSDPQLGTDPTQLTVTGQTLTTIDSTWLSANGQNLDGGPGPWYLDTADRYYRLGLSTDSTPSVPVTTLGTAFIVLAANVTLDLNGNTITYGNTDLITVPNGGFETGVLTPWNVSGAPTAEIYAARTGMWGNWMLRLPNISTNQTIISSAITIPRANVEYVATITPRADVYGTAVTISVIDTVTSTVLASASSADPNRGFSAFVQFVPTTLHDIKLQIDIDPNGTDTVDLDYAAVFRSRDYGVVATVSYWSLPSQLQSSEVVSNAHYVDNFIIENGSIIQGSGRSLGGSSVYAKSVLSGLIDGIEAQVSGMDTSPIYGQNSYNLTIRNNTVVGDINLISDRMGAFAGIDLARTGGTMIVENNHISGHLQNGIVVIGDSFTALNYDAVIISGNDIRVNSDWTNSYGVGIGWGVNAFEIMYNTIIPLNGRGITMDGSGGQNEEGTGRGTTQDGLIHDNYVEAQELASLEYGYASLEATALRWRNYTITQKNIRVYNNTFTPHTDVGMAWNALGCRISYVNDKGQMDNANNIIEDNVFKAILIDPDSNYNPPYSSQAHAFSVSGVDAGTGTIVRNNRFESNSISLSIGDSDSDGLLNTEILFETNTIAKSTDGATVTYSSITVGDWSNTVSDVNFINTQYEGGATSDVEILNTDTGAISYGTGWLLDVTVNDSNNDPILGATVEIKDNTGATVYTGTTNASGQIIDIPVVTAITTTSGSTSQGPFTISATANGHTASTTGYAITSNKQSLTLTTN